MYAPGPFVVAEEDADALITRLARSAAALLVSLNENGEFLATHAPLLWDGQARIARGHIARANRHWQCSGARALIVISGPEAYVSPSFYPSKLEHGKAVPTWNYEAVHLSGAVEWFDDPVRLKALVGELSAVHEHDRPQPWSIGEAPSAYIEAMLGAIVGFEMRVEKLEAKRKLSQNKSAADFEGVIRGLEDGAGAGAEIAALMRALGRASDDANSP